MSSAVRLLNDAGYNAPPGVLDAAPVLSQTAQTATDAAIGGDHELTRGRRALDTPRHKP